MKTHEELLAGIESFVKEAHQSGYSCAIVIAKTEQDKLGQYAYCGRPVDVIGLLSRIQFAINFNLLQAENHTAREI